jgi:cytidylate kinase
MDGRDIGTVVLPDAEVKIFLTADPQKRAERRYKELKEKGSDITLQQVLDDMAKRDASDRGRKTAPLKKAEDAVEADTSALTLDESFQLIKSIIEEKVPHEN